jgi:hypothetical protein
MDKKMNDYIVVTTIQTYRHRYVMHKDDLQNLNLSHQASEKDLIDWAQDTVTMEDAEEFSQFYLNEVITDVNVINEDEMLNLFDKDNDYLNGWDKETKLQWVRTLLKD